MTDMSRRYWTLAIFVVVIVVFFYLADYFTQQLTVNVKKRRSRPAPRQGVPASPSLTPTNAPAPPVGRRFG